ncbi:glutamate-5-semialdehyde dehydrogenase [Pontibacillus yanchengensis]|uniref:Glutamate-5-semialdehyde dehydrogenase n=2 Tax=Pontibacillus yanchengensis TaxID=462910 RepID=A0ACC7VB58_9BACI|nr:glutamate-5-semialdehyde dehydrogenase [Pontibacillus yanchengensis]MYL32011.1 glutamate-5-semialdehyde dehydrogenase [Pontibacillus yanchengensis]MYL52588.1 glutamate-5-semialdehyde dehydrogenase [Pontibacillus yanchengensis]
MTTTKQSLTVKEQAMKAQKASKLLAILSTEEKNEALRKVAARLETEYELILKANEVDLEEGRKKNFDDAFMDRLALSKDRVLEFAQGLRDVAELEDPNGIVKSQWTLDNGLDVQQVTVPLGVIGMIYEARPNVTVDATGLALKSGNAIVLKGGSSAIASNKAIVEVMRSALAETRISEDAIQFIDSTDREATQQLFTMKEHIDVLIPRGGESLINAVVDNATVPVLETGVGNCHIYIDKEADVEKALSILVNAKTDRPAVCNAAETVIVHQDWLQEHQEAFKNALAEHGIHAHADEYAQALIPGSDAATEEDWANEYLSRDIAVKTVSDVLEAIEHIEIYGTKHSEAIVTENQKNADTFMKLVDAAALYHNASTRFTDGGALGFGAEIGISTQKLHARGPMGLPALTTIKYMMTGTGQIR